MGGVKLLESLVITSPALEARCQDTSNANYVAVLNDYSPNVSTLRYHRRRHRIHVSMKSDYQALECPWRFHGELHSLQGLGGNSPAEQLIAVV